MGLPRLALPILLAYLMVLQLLSGRFGWLHRSCRVICQKVLQNGIAQVAFGDLTKVKFAVLSEAEIAYYVDHYKPFDKAGSYAIQEWIGLCKIEKIDGTYANVMGLPVERVWSTLESIID